MRTFTVSDVELSRKRLSPAMLMDSLEARAACSLEAGASNLGSLVTGWAHPFVQAAYFAFAEHLPLVLSPDDVWLCLAQGFGTHVNIHAEAVRSRLVAHDGKAVIRIRRDEFVKGSAVNDWSGVFAEFSDQLAGHLGKKRDLVVADFSTTGPVEKGACQIVLMSAMQQYFDYGMMTLCGIPRITLLGTVEDWKAVRRRAEVLSEFDLGRWVRALIPILDQFVAAAGGRVDDAFWRSFYKLADESGGPYVSGWINVLFPYIEEMAPSSDGFTGPGEPRPNPYVETWESVMEKPFESGPTGSGFPLGLSRAPFLWEYLGSEIPMEFLGGFVGVSQDPVTLAVQPAIGWAVRAAAQPAAAPDGAPSLAPLGRAPRG